MAGRRTFGLQHALLALACLVVGSTSCKPRAPKAVHVPDIAQGFDASPIDAGALSTQPGHRHHVLNMGVPEVAHRLGAFAWRSQTTITVGDENKNPLRQVHTSLLVQDKAGNTHLQAGNGDHQLELIAVEDRAYVRQDRGHLRRKRRQEVDEQEMAEAAVSGLRQMLQHFSGVTLVHPNAATWERRQATRYELEMDVAGKGEALAPQPSLALLPIAAPSRWFEEAKHHRITGKVVVDNDTGVVLKADMTGSMMVTGATGQPLTLTLRCVHTLTDVGVVQAVREPAQSISEVRRPVRPKNPLGFMGAGQRGAAGQEGTGKKAPVGQDDATAAVGAEGGSTGAPVDEELPEETAP